MSKVTKREPLTASPDHTSNHTSPSHTEHRWAAASDATGRIDQYIAAKLGLSRSRVVALLAAGHILADGAVPKKSEPVAPGQELTVRLPPPTSLDAKAQDIPLEIVYQDQEIAVVNKQPGLVVHPAPGHPDGTLVNGLLYHIGDLASIGGRLRPGIVHRLDQDTSGLLVVAKTDLAHRHLSAALQARTVQREYTVALWGHLASPAAGQDDAPVTIDRPIGRHPNDRIKMAVVPSGRPSVTHFAVKRRWPAACLCTAQLETGRTHQIRVHAESLGHPVVGDSLYGKGRERGFTGATLHWARELAKRTPRQFLHAGRLSFRHPKDGQPMTFKSPLPPDLAEAAAWADSNPQNV